MNKNHEACGGEEWRALMRDTILPRALAGIDLGEDVLEVGPGYGATTDVLAASVPRLTAVEIDSELAAMLTERFAGNSLSFTMLHHVPTRELQDRVFAEAARVLRSGAPLVASDSTASPEMEEHHVGDTYNPIDPGEVAPRLEAAGFLDVQVTTSPFGWTAVARRA